VIRGAPHITRSILLGSILCNLLLVLGGSLFFAGYDKNRLRFDRHLTTTLSSLMMVVFIMLATPTALEALSSRHDVSAEEAILTQQATAVNLIALLGIFLFFRLNTHADMFASTPIQHGSSDVQSSHSRTIVQDLQPLAGPWRSLLVLLVASLCALACAFQLVDSVSSIGKTLGTNPSFAALAIIPLVGNITKHRMIVEASRAAQQIERGIRAIINGILRLTMLVAPIIVMVGWALDQPLILKFDEFEATTLLLSIVVMTYLISDGRSNYFEGLMLIGT
jgi:Ca2+:H+ antiporter